MSGFNEFSSLRAFIHSVVQQTQAKLVRAKSSKDSSSLSTAGSIIKAALVRQWDVLQVTEYLTSDARDNNLKKASSKVVQTFKDNQVDGATFLALTYEDLTDDLEIEDTEYIRELLQHIALIHQN